MLTWVDDQVWDCDDDRLPKNSDINRQKPDKGFVDTMAIRQLNPIIVRMDNFGAFHLEAGRRRLLAVRQLKEDGRSSGNIDVRILKGDEEDGGWITLVENAQSSANPVSDYQAVKKFLLAGKNYKTIAELIGTSITYVKKLDTDFARVPDWALVAIQQGNMVVNVAKEVGKLSTPVQAECKIEMEQSPKKKLTMDMVMAHHRLTQAEATAVTMSFSGPGNPRRIFTRDDLMEIREILITSDPEQAVMMGKSHIDKLLAQEE
jgi:hypothetical protein